MARRREKSEAGTVDLAEQIAAAEAQIAEQSKKIEFFLTEYTVELLADKMNRNEFIIPDYQRDDIWEPERKSKFIESLLMGLPIPFLFFWQQPDTGKLEIVDGAQRLRTLQQYLLGGFRVKKLKKLTQLEGLRFSDLPPSRQRKINNKSIRGIVLNEYADEAARQDLFERINTSSKTAKSAEVRRGSLSGPFQDLVIELAKDPLFVELAPLPEKQRKERAREELVTRFFGYGDGLEDYKDNPSEFLYSYVQAMNERVGDDHRLVNRCAREFKATLKFVQRVFPYGFARREGARTTPRSRFEAIAIGSRLALRERPALKTETPEVADWLESDKFREIVGSDGANVKGRLTGRIGYVRDRLLGVEP